MAALVKLIGRWSATPGLRVERMWVNPDDVSLLRETPDGETLVVLRSRKAHPLNEPAAGFWVAAPIDEVAETLYGGGNT
ncbi:hypothetical protein [Nocardioides montaniterrae]